MEKISSYFSESYKELLENVTWPTRESLVNSTIIVLAATGLITLSVGLMDFASNQLLKMIYSLFK